MGLPHRRAEALVHLEQIELGPRAFAPVSWIELDDRVQVGQAPGCRCGSCGAWPRYGDGLDNAPPRRECRDA
jgi:hypothetical protein